MNLIPLQHGFLLQFGRGTKSFRFLDPHFAERERMRHMASSVTLPENFEMNSNSNYVHFKHNGHHPSHPQHHASQQSLHQQPPRGNENILPAVLEFREESEEAFFDTITVGLDTGKVQFKLAPTYTIYMGTRFRASTHYRPELTPEERAVRLTAMPNHVAKRLNDTVSLNQHDAARLAFWMANSSELLHFLKSDRHITSFSLQAQDILADTVHLSFKNLVFCLQNDLKQAMPQILTDSADLDIKGVMNVLSAAMNLLRKCRVNAALTIQLFSQLFHFINMWTFNKIISSGDSGKVNYCTNRCGYLLKTRLQRIAEWAEKQGLELAADCHLARIVQAAHLLLARKNTAEDIASVSSICFKLNSLQLNKLLRHYEPDPNEKPISTDMIDTIVRVAENTVDDLIKSEGREVRLEEDYVLQLPFLLPEDGYSCDIVRGVPGGLVEFISPLQQVGLCVLTPQPTSRGFWTIYMDRLEDLMMASPVPRSPSEISQNTMNGEIIHSPPPLIPHHQLQQQQQHQQQLPPQALQQQQQQQQQPEIVRIQLAKSANGGMGLSIVAAKGVGKDKLGIYIKAVVDGGAAYHDGRLEAGDQLLTVDGHSLVGITQERAAEIMLRTGSVVELEVAKQGALYHGLATLLSQPSPMTSRSSSTMSQSKSIPSLHPGHGQPGFGGHPNDPHFQQNQNHPAFRSSGGATYHGPPPVSRGPPGNNYYSNRSNSVQNLTHPRQSNPPHQNAFNGRTSQPIPPPIPSDEQQGFYQNVGPAGPVGGSSGDMQHLQQLQQLSLPRHLKDPTDMFHASPRVAGTPQTSGGVDKGLVNGPEKPQRHYSYDHPHPPQLVEGKREVHFQDNSSKVRKNSYPPAAHVNGNGTNRVRFQEPVEKNVKVGTCMKLITLILVNPKTIPQLPIILKIIFGKFFPCSPYSCMSYRNISS